MYVVARIVYTYLFKTPFLYHNVFVQYDSCETLLLDTFQGVVSMDCEKANKGLFSGLLVAVVTLIAIATFFVFESRLNNPITAIKVRTGSQPLAVA